MQFYRELKLAPMAETKNISLRAVQFYRELKPAAKSSADPLGLRAVQFYRELKLRYSVVSSATRFESSAVL